VDRGGGRDDMRVVRESLRLFTILKKGERHVGGTAWRSRARSDRKELVGWGNHAPAGRASYSSGSLVSIPDGRLQLFNVDQ
jgi:hypothetical protein